MASTLEIAQNKILVDYSFKEKGNSNNFLIPSVFPVFSLTYNLINSEKKRIDLVCKLTNDETTLFLAKIFKLKPFSKGAKFLNHYLEGTEKSIEVDLQTLLKDDKKVNQRVQIEIVKSLKRKILKGIIPIKQSHYGVEDYKNSLGAINLNYEIINPNSFNSLKKVKVKIWFKNLYRWHPEANRKTKCVHIAAENLKLKGAKEFYMIGEAIIFIDLKKVEF